MANLNTKRSRAQFHQELQARKRFNPDYRLASPRRQSPRHYYQLISYACQSVGGFNCRHHAALTRPLQVAVRVNAELRERLATLIAEFPEPVGGFVVIEPGMPEWNRQNDYECDQVAA